MNTYDISGAQFREMVISGAVLLEKSRELIDALNVFPVPDGDTGTNMTMTMQSAVHEIQALDASATVTEMADALSKGALRGARGNSGVILSQLFRGFSKAVKGCAMLDGQLMAKGLKMGSDAAYKAVMKPKEGTILTVSRIIAEDATELAESGANLYSIMDCMISSGERALADTPNLLPVLKEAGVVDSGGKGLLTIYRGFKAYLDGEEVEHFASLDREEQEPEQEEVAPAAERYGYYMEFQITHLSVQANGAAVAKFRESLDKYGETASVRTEDGIVYAQVYSDAPGRILQAGIRLGELDGIVIRNLKEEQRQAAEELKRNEKEYGIVAVSTGEGINEMFLNLGVDELISGGQTMNPSIDTIASAINRVNARNVFILPNNSNIILASQEAAELTNRKVILIPTKSIPQGIAACMAFLPDSTPEENEEMMREAIGSVVSGSVTYAVRKTSFEGTKINEGDIIGLLNNKLCSCGSTIEDVCIQVVRKMIDAYEDGSTVMLYVGKDTPEADAEQLCEKLSAMWPDCEFLIQPGGQPLYYYYFGLS